MNTAAKLKNAIDHDILVMSRKENTCLLADISFEKMLATTPPTKCLSLDTFYDESQEGQMEQVYHRFCSPICRHYELCHSDCV